MKKSINIFNLITLIVPVITIGILLPFEARAEKPDGLLKNTPVSLAGDTSINSKYVWRGFKLDDDAVMQSGINIDVYELTATVWGSFDIDNDDPAGSDEVDYVIDYSHSFGKIGISVGHTYYDFPFGNASSREFYAGIAYDSFLSPSFTYNRDYGNESTGGGDGIYLSFDIGHSIVLIENVSLDLTGHLGRNDELFITGDEGDILLGTGLSCKLSDNCTFTPNVNYSIPYGDMEKFTDGNQDNEFFGGFIINFEM